MVNNYNKPVIFGLSNCTDLAVSIAKKTNIELGTVSLSTFADGEILTFPTTTVRRRSVFVIQSTSTPVNNTLMELLIFIDALKRAGALSISVILPYLCYARQDRKSYGRHPITAKLVANMIQLAGANRISIFDLHSAQIQGFFDIPTENLSAGPLMINFLKAKFQTDQITIVSPDYGGVARARHAAQLLNCGLCVIDKRRTKPNECEVTHVLGDVDGKTCIILDDMIDTGNTLIKAANALIKANAKKIIVAATHGIFSNNALQNLHDSCIDEIVITNTILQPDLEKWNKIKIVAIDDFLAEIIIAVHSGGSISKVYRKYIDNSLF